MTADAMTVARSIIARINQVLAVRLYPSPVNDWCPEPLLTFKVFINKSFTEKGSGVSFFDFQMKELLLDIENICFTARQWQSKYALPQIVPSYNSQIRVCLERCRRIVLAEMSAIEERSAPAFHRSTMSGQQLSGAKSNSTGEARKRVFVVHGHDNVRSTAARTLEKVGLDAIILRDRGGEGRSILNNLHAYSEVDFAVVLFTGDDVGGEKPATGEVVWKKRARQNVVFELGYFIAKLGEKNVRILMEEGVEVPSDYLGYLYITLDSHGAWQIKLIRDIQATLGIKLNISDLPV